MLLFKESAEVISIDNGQYNSYDFSRWVEISAYRKNSGWCEDEESESVSTFSIEIRVPRIIRLVFYDKFPKSYSKFNRRNIFARDENRCQYCGKRFQLSELSLDHIVPRSQGGGNTWTNIVCACTECNKDKGGRRPEEAGMKLIRKPVKPKHYNDLRLRFNSSKYKSWKQFLNNAYWTVPLE